MLKTLEKSAGIKSVQRGAGQLPNLAGAFVTIPISAVDTGKSVVILNGGSVNNAGGVCYLKEFTPISVTVGNPYLPGHLIYFSWQVIEFY